MVSLDEAIIARLTSHGETFEILVDPDQVEKIRAGKVQDVTEHLAIDAVFRDAKEGEHASEDKIEKVFGTSDVNDIALRILKDGDIQLTTEQRRKYLDEKKKKIVTAIVREAWNPQTKTPHPPARIERALEEAKFRVDPFRPVDPQVKEAIQAIKPLLPISMEQVQVAFKIPAVYTGKAYGEVRNLGELVRESWEPDGSLIGVLKIPAGMQGDIFDELNRLTKGEAETKVLK
ncbi:MAG: ribosome assembly factor SBDS [Euryarchaeota archaeon]|nr:ribosome assembly factor SBDS [Euryarchaeota archaeon]